MNKDTALKLALEALKKHQSMLGLTSNKRELEAIAAINQALAAQPSPVPKGSIQHLKTMMEESAWEGGLNLSDALANIDEFYATAQPAPVQEPFSPEAISATQRAWQMGYEAAKAIFNLGTECPSGWVGSAIAVHTAPPTAAQPAPATDNTATWSDELALIESVLKGYPDSIAKADALRAVRGLQATPPAAQRWAGKTDDGKILVNPPAAPVQEPTVPDNSQDWAGMSGIDAYMLIERHANGWGDIRKMMGEWLAANSTPPAAHVQPKQEPVKIDGNTSDGYHTFNELYEFRKAYNAVLFNEWAAGGKCSVHKSWRHHDGELCFGGGWFIVVAVLPEGQISNHYKARDWDLFAVPETECALFEFDGHTSNDVVARLKAYTAPPTAPAAPVQPVGKVIASVPHLRSISVELLPEVPVPPEDSLIYAIPPAAQPAQQEPVASKPDWQTIETAPKGYTDVLVWNGQNVGEARYIPEEDVDEFGWWWANTAPGNYGESRIDRQPTHWMPMPAAPIEAAHGIKEKNTWRETNDNRLASRLAARR